MKQKVYRLGAEERQKLVERLTEVLKAHDEVVFAYLYGSFAEGLPFHDADIGVYVSDVTEEKATDYSIDLAQTLAKKLSVPVDVRVLNFAPISFVYHVICGNLILERDEEIRTRVVERTMQRYLDLKPLILRGIKEAFGS